MNLKYLIYYNNSIFYSAYAVRACIAIQNFSNNILEFILQMVTRGWFKDNIVLINRNYPFGKIVGEEPFCGVVLVHPCDLVSYLVLQTSFMIFEQFKAPVEVVKFISGWIKVVENNISTAILQIGNSSLHHYVIMDSSTSQPTAVNTEDEGKDLGIWCIGDLTNVRVLKVVRSFKIVSPDMLVFLYKIYVRSHLEYCVPVWCPYCAKDIDVLEKVQWHATKLLSWHLIYLWRVVWWS